MLAAVIAMELALVALNVILNIWYNFFYNTLQDHNWNGFVKAIVIFCALTAIFIVLAVYKTLRDAMAANSLAALDDANLSAELAERGQSLSHAASWRQSRQPGPAHRR